MFGRSCSAVALAACVVLLAGCGHSHTDRATLEGDLLVKSTPRDPFGNPIGDPQLSPADAATQVLLLQGSGIAKVTTPIRGHFAFRDIPIGSYRICAQLFGTPSDTTQALDVGPGANRLPAAIVLPDTGLTGSPNPSARGASFRFGIPVAKRADLRIYSDVGRLVRVLVNVTLPAGTHEVSWDSKDDQNALVGPGLYVAVLVTSDPAGTADIVAPPPGTGIGWGRAHVLLVAATTDLRRPH